MTTTGRDPRTFDVPEARLARYRFAIAFALTMVAFWLVILKVGIDQGSFGPPFVLFALALQVLFLASFVLPIVSSSRRVVLSDDGVLATGMLGRRMFIPWSDIASAKLLPISLARRRAELRLTDVRGRVRATITGHIENFDEVVRLVRTRVPPP
jgi:hypothetical protein